MLGLLTTGQRPCALRHPATGGGERTLSDRLGVLLHEMPGSVSQNVRHLGARRGRRETEGGLHG